MYVKAVVAILVVIASVDAQFNYGGGGPVLTHPVAPIPIAYPPMPYDFGYGVSDAYTGNDFGHSETSDGQNKRGSYFVLLPDGRKQIVSYTADQNGFNAEVSYEGVARVVGPVGHGGPVGPIGPIGGGYGK